MIHYSGVINNIGNRKILYTFLIIPVVVLGILLCINWNTGIIFSQFHGDYIRGQFKYVLITYALLYCYYFASVFVAIYISFIDNSEKNRRFKIAIICFTIIPVICGILQLRHPDCPYHVMGFTLSAFILFICEIIEERELIADENLREHQKEILDNCSEIMENNLSVEKNINSLLKLIGKYYNSDRVFILEFSEDKTSASCTYEWCSPEKERQIENLQNIPESALKLWIDKYKTGEEDVVLSLEQIKNLDMNLYTKCLFYNVTKIMNCPLKSAGSLFGFIGIDNPENSNCDFRIIRTISIYIYSEILRRNNYLREQQVDSAIISALAEDYSSVYYINTQNDELVPYRYNSQMKKRFEKYYDQGISYSESYKMYVNEVVYAEDKEEMLEFGKIENLQKKLKYRKNVRKQYRCTINGKVEYFQAKWVKLGDSDSALSEMILGYASIDDQVRNDALINEQKTTIEKQLNELTTVKQQAEQADLNSQLDSLTGLYNKIQGHYRIESYIKNKDPAASYSIMFMDIDHFKNFNDSYGHLVGDEVLTAVGNAVKSICRSDDIAIRFGGDEFVILFKNVNNQNIILSKADTLRELLKEYSINKDYNLTCSIGFVITSSSDVEESIEKADKALYEVKNTTRDNVKMYKE